MYLDAINTFLSLPSYNEEDVLDKYRKCLQEVHRGGTYTHDAQQAVLLLYKTCGFPPCFYEEAKQKWCKSSSYLYQFFSKECKGFASENDLAYADTSTDILTTMARFQMQPSSEQINASIKHLNKNKNISSMEIAMLQNNQDKAKDVFQFLLDTLYGENAQTITYELYFHHLLKTLYKAFPSLTLPPYYHKLDIALSNSNDSNDSNESSVEYVNSLYTFCVVPGTLEMHCG